MMGSPANASDFGVAAEADIPAPFDDYLFARGYVFRSGELPRAPGSWSYAQFGDFHLRFDPRLPCTRACRAAVDLLCLGNLFDPRSPMSSVVECVDVLAEALESSEERFLEELSFTGGRYVIAYRRPDGESYIVNDASGMKSAFYYARERRVIASHVRLGQCNAEDAGERPAIGIKFGYPGIRTPNNNIFVLTPNTRLRLRTMRPERFWPEQPIRPISAQEAAEQVLELFRGSYAHIAKYHRPLVSVTAGIDSRLTLAMSRDYPATKYFTYYRSDDIDTDSMDRDFGLILKEHFGRDHDMLDGAQRSQSVDGFNRLLKTNTFYSHFRNIAYTYWLLYGQDQYLHVRSNIAEVGRQFWGGRSANRDVDLARLWIGNRTCPPGEVFSAIDAFREFADVTRLFDCAEWVDINSLFYWEFRMASWHSQVLVESDPAFDSASLYNCRRILELLLSVPIEDREKASVIKAVIQAAWPELTEHPVNGKPFWAFRKRSGVPSQDARSTGAGMSRGDGTS